MHERLIASTHQHHWHFRLRLTGNTLIHRPHHPACAVKNLCPPAGHAHFFHAVAILGTGVGPVHLALACPEDQPGDPWYIVSDEPTDLQTLDEYGWRFDIEETFLDEKSGGFQLQTSELMTAEALERLVLILAIATLHFTSVGLGVMRAKVRRWVDTHWDRGLSYLKIGWRWLRQQYRRGWQAFAAFWLDPVSDPIPAIASRRVTTTPKRQWVVCLLC